MQLLEVILILLAIAAILRLVSIRLSVPQPVLLVLGGLVLAIIPGLPHFQPDPGVVFLIFIPPLLYRAALETSLRDFKRNLRSISLLAFGLVLITMCAVAWAAHSLIPGMSWSSGFVLGTIVSPPDAVSVTAITRRLKLPVTIDTVLEGESLVNDATALIAYRMGFAAVVADAFSFIFFRPSFPALENDFICRMGRNAWRRLPGYRAYPSHGYRFRFAISGKGSDHFSDFRGDSCFADRSRSFT